MSSWFTDERPVEIHDFWMDTYPEIDTIPNKVAQMQKAGYLLVACFVLPENCLTKHFYETELYDKYKDFYGYAFYIGKKI